MNNLKQSSTAALNYHASRNRFPTGLVAADADSGNFSGATNLWIEMLPHFEETNLRSVWDIDDYRNNIGNSPKVVAAQIITILLCPSDALPSPVHQIAFDPPWDWTNGLYGLSSYGGNAGIRSCSFVHPEQTRDGIFFVRSRVGSKDITDGMSKTILLGEWSHDDPVFDRLCEQHDPGMGPLAAWGVWAAATSEWGSQGDLFRGSIVPINYEAPPNPDEEDWDWLDHRLSAFGSEHASGANFAFADGSVRFIADSVALETLQALSTRSGEELIDLP